MEVVRKYVDASSLMTIMKLPDNFKNQKLEVIILPTEEKESVEKKGADAAVHRHSTFFRT